MMTLDELAQSYFSRDEVEFARTQTYNPSSVAALAQTARDSMRGHVSATIWVETYRGRVNVWFDGRSPVGGVKPDLSVTCERLAEIALGKAQPLLF